MAQLWVEDGEQDWAVLPLEIPALALESRPPRAPDPTPPAGGLSRSVRLLRGGEQPEFTWTLVAGPEIEVAVNGLPLSLGIRLLRDRDEIRIATVGRFFFSSESRPRVETFSAGEREITCPRCTTEIEDGDPVVRCPGCQILHHERTDLSCWSHIPECAVCHRPTAMDGGFSWTPEEI